MNECRRGQRKRSDRTALLIATLFSLLHLYVPLYLNLHLTSLYTFICIFPCTSPSMFICIFLMHKRDCTCNALHVHLILADPLRMNFPGLSIQRWLMLQHNKSQMVVGVTPTHTHAHGNEKMTSFLSAVMGTEPARPVPCLLRMYVSLFTYAYARLSVCVWKPDHLRGCCDSLWNWSLGKPAGCCCCYWRQ